MINLMYAGNTKVFDGMLTSILSILKHNNDELNIYILTVNLHDFNANYLPITDEQIVFFRQIGKRKK